MVALKASEVEAFIARPDPDRRIVLVFGPDAGLVHERVETIVGSAIEDPHDPFLLARIDGDTLLDEPQRLVEEAQTIPLFGGRRAVWVKAGNRNFAAAVEALIAAPPTPDCLVVIEAGDLKRSVPLRVVCERAANVAALPCYVDGERELLRLIDSELRTAGLSIEPDARELLVSLLGGDRQASRNEIRKLALYAHGQNRVEPQDVLAVVADASALALEAVVDAAFVGKSREVEAEYSKARATVSAASAIVRAVLRQALQLHRARTAIEAGTAKHQAMGALAAVHFRRKPLVESALAAWTTARLTRTIAQLAEAELEARRRPYLADAIVQRAVLQVAVAARGRD